MAEFMLHIIKVNVLSAVIIFIVLAVSKLLDKKYSSRWKYLIWLFVSVFLLIPVKFPSHAGGLNIEVPKQIVRAEVNRSTAVPNTENLQIPANAKENGSEPLKDTDKKADMQDRETSKWIPLHGSRQLSGERVFAQQRYIKCLF